MPLAVIQGATLRCDHGTSVCKLNVIHATTAQSSQQPIASILDHEAGQSIGLFGTCKHVAGPCTPDTPSPWFPGAPQLRLCVPRPPLSSDSFLLCVAHGPAAIHVEDPGQGGLHVPAAGVAAAPFGPYYYIYRYYDFLRRHPGLSPPDYYLEYGNKFYQLFTRTGLSDRGEAWLRAVARDLQEAIEALRRAGPEAFDQLELDGKAFRKFAFDTHPEIYRKNGFLELSAFDKAEILTLVGGNTSLGEIPELLKQTGGLAFEAAKHPLATVGDLLDSKFIETPKHILDEIF